MHSRQHNFDFQFNRPYEREQGGLAFDAQRCSMRGCPAERNKRKSSSPCSLDLYFFLIRVSAENPHSHKLVEVKGIRTFIAFVEIWGNSLSTENQKRIQNHISYDFCWVRSPPLMLTSGVKETVHFKTNTRTHNYRYQ